jgi:hypothetical protein
MEFFCYFCGKDCNGDNTRFVCVDGICGHINVCDQPDEECKSYQLRNKEIPYDYPV